MSNLTNIKIHSMPTHEGEQPTLVYTASSGTTSMLAGQKQVHVDVVTGAKSGGLVDGNYYTIDADTSNPDPTANTPFSAAYMQFQSEVVNQGSPSTFWFIQNTSN